MALNTDEIVKEIGPFLDQIQMDIQEEDIRKNSVLITKALAVFIRELESCAMGGQVVICPGRYAELLRVSIFEKHYSLFITSAGLLQWYMFEHSPYSSFLWSMIALLEQINESGLCPEVIDLKLLKDTLTQ